MRPFLMLVLLALAAGIFAQGIGVPQLVESASLSINESGTVLVAGGAMKDLWMKINIPLSTDYQQMNINSPYKIDAGGNPYVEIRENNPVNPYMYSRKIEVSTVQRKTISLPENFKLTADELKYLAPTNRTQSDSPQIAALAANLTAGSRDNFEKVARLAIWVNSNIVYNENYLGQEESALAVLQHRQGVCFEYATLFAALARSAGIPARYVTGYVYSDVYNNWLGHAWDEVYLGEWVPVDPTWFEVGATDALHVESGKYLEMVHENNLVANIYPATAQLQWESNGRSGALAANIMTKDAKSGAADATYRLSVVSSKIAPGDTTLVFLEMEGKDYRVVPVSLDTCVGNGALGVENEKQYLILRPGQTSVAVWKISTPSDVPSSYYYTCPLTLNSPYLEERVVEVKVDPRVRKLPEYGAQIKQSTMVSGGQNAVYLTLPQERQGKAYYVITDEGVREDRVSSPSYFINFNARWQGEKTAYVSGDGGGYYLLSYNVSIPANSSVAIDGLDVPSSLFAGKTAHAQVNVSAKSYPSNVNVELYLGDEKLEQGGMMQGPTSFDFEFTPNAEGPYPVLARLTSDASGSSEKNYYSTVLSQPMVKIASAAFTRKGGAYETVIVMNQSGQPIDPRIILDGQEKGIIDGPVIFQLQPGDHNAKISWMDAAGNRYERNELVQVKPYGLFESVVPTVPSPEGAGTCPLSLAILFVVPITLLSKR